MEKQNSFQEQKELMILADIDGDELNARYQAYSSIDDQSSLQAIRQKAHIERHRSSRKYLRYAAVALLFVMGGAAYWYSQYTKVTPPEIPQAVQLAMKQSTDSGKQDAVISKLEIKRENADSNHDVIDDKEAISPAEGSSLNSVSESEVIQSLTKEPLLAARRVTTKHDTEYWVTLDDGTLVHLNYNTRLIHPERFGRGDRNVILDGEAYFMVAQDKSRPFVVHTQNGDIKVYGTEFNVNTDASSTTVVLVKGSVGLTSAKGIELRLEPGQLGEMKANEIELVDKQVETDIYTSWNEGHYKFKDCRLDKLMQILGHWYGMEVEFENYQNRSIPFTGSINKYKSITPALHAIEYATGLTITVKNNHIVIK